LKSPTIAAGSHNGDDPQSSQRGEEDSHIKTNKEKGKIDKEKPEKLPRSIQYGRHRKPKKGKKKHVGKKSETPPPTAAIDTGEVQEPNGMKCGKSQKTDKNLRGRKVPSKSDAR